MNEQLQLKELIQGINVTQYNIKMLYSESNSDNVRFYLRNSLDYLEGMQRELEHALEAAEKAG